MHQPMDTPAADEVVKLELAAKLLAERFSRWRESLGVDRTASLSLDTTMRSGERVAIVISSGALMAPILSAAHVAGVMVQPSRHDCGTTGEQPVSTHSDEPGTLH